MSLGLRVDVLEHEDGKMIKEIIYGRLGLSRGLLRRMKNGGGVYLNGTPAYITQRVVAGDTLNIQFADSPTNLVPQKLDLDILYEDSALLVINKRADMAVYPTRSYPERTLANGIAYLWQERGLERKVRLVHRLDRETSGTIIVAKEPFAYQGLVEQLRSNELSRKYLAIVKGILPEKSGVIDQPIGRSESLEGHALRRIVSSTGKDSKTYFQVIQEYGNLSLLELKLASGRTHQIRVHMKWLGFPIIGDEMYYKGSDVIKRQALHAWSVNFKHPRTGKNLLIKAPLPSDMKAIVKKSC